MKKEILSDIIHYTSIVLTVAGVVGLMIFGMFSCHKYMSSQEHIDKQDSIRNEKHRQDSIQECIRNEKLKPFDYKIKFGLKSLKYNKEKNICGGGSFFLGCGSVSISENVWEDYYFYVETKQGILLAHVPVEAAYIIETDSIEPCIVKTYGSIQYQEKIQSFFHGSQREGYLIYATHENMRPAIVYISNYKSLENLNSYPLDYGLTYSNYDQIERRTKRHRINQNYIQIYVPKNTIIEKFEVYQ